MYLLIHLGVLLVAVVYTGHFVWVHEKRVKHIKDVAWKRKPWTPEFAELLNKRKLLTKITKKGSYEQLFLDECRKRRFYLYCIYYPDYPPPKKKKKYIDIFGIEPTET
jgi:hypothetical protein